MRQSFGVMLLLVLVGSVLFGQALTPVEVQIGREKSNVSYDTSSTVTGGAYTIAGATLVSHRFECADSVNVYRTIQYQDERLLTWATVTTDTVTAGNSGTVSFKVVRSATVDQLAGKIGGKLRVVLAFKATGGGIPTNPKYWSWWEWQK